VTARGVIRWLWLPVIFALAWSGWVLWSRRSEAAAMEKAATEKRAADDRAILQKLGGDELKILMFYANPPSIAKGERGLLCYGVSNASAVEVKPTVDGVGPSLSRCVEIRPAQSTEYTLTARDSQGKALAQTVSVTVR